MRAGGNVLEREWMDLTAEVMTAPLVELPTRQIAEQLLRTFDGVGCAYSTQRDGAPLRGELYPLAESFGGHRAEIMELGPQEAPRINPILLFYRASGVSGGFMQVADVPTQLIEPGALPAWYARTRPWGCADQMALPMYLRPTGHRAFVIGRDTPFSATEMELGARVWRLLIGFDRQAQAFARLRPSFEVAEEARLTPRELIVLSLLGEGLTAAAIGRRLTIAERTVHKHLEHAYAKLGVRDRLSAVLRAQHLGLIA